jgi:hypothetical protein
MAIEAMPYWSQGPLQSSIQNVKTGAFWRHSGGLLNFFVWMVAEACKVCVQTYAPTER